MPARTPARWVDEAGALQTALQELGYLVQVQYAEGDVRTQANQVRNLVRDGADLVVVAPIDGGALSEPVERARAAGVPVIAYDRPLHGSDAATYTVTSDGEAVGAALAHTLLHGLGLTDLSGTPTQRRPQGPFAVELFAGDPGDLAASSTYRAALRVLDPYLKDGTLVVPSGAVGFEEVATPRADAAAAQARMTRLLDTGGQARVDAVLSTHDAMSRAILSTFTAYGYGSAARPMPVVTGRGAERESVRSILRGEQHATVFVDSRELVRVTLEAADALLSGREAVRADAPGGSPEHRVSPSVVVADNVRETLVDTGVFAPGDLGLG